MRVLAQLAAEDPRVHLLFKPWHGERRDAVVEQAALAARSAPGRVLVVAPRSSVHNVELLGATDVLVATFSSLVAEAHVLGVPSVVLRYPESVSYFEAAHFEIYRELVDFVPSPAGVFDAVRARLAGPALSEVRLDRLFAAGFGPPDGKAGARIAREALELARHQPSSR